MRIDPLIFLFILEALVLSALAVLYLLYRLKKQSINSVDPKELSEISTMLEDEIAKIGEEIRHISEQDQGAGRESYLLEKKMVVLQKISESIKNQPSHIPDVLKTFISELGALMECNANIPTAQNSDGIKNSDSIKGDGAATGELSVKEVLEIFRKQSKGFAEILETQEIKEQLQDKFSQLKDNNQNLIERITKFKDRGASVEEVNSILKSLSQTNKELNLCVETLEKENDRLFKKLKAYEEEFNRIQDGFIEIQELDMNKGSQEIKSLKEALQQKDKEIEELKKTLKDLEAEYMVLYKQIHS